MGCSQSVAAPLPVPEQHPEAVDEFEKVSVLGAGFSCEVWKGKNKSTKEDVAVKVVKKPQGLIDNNNVFIEKIVGTEVAILKALNPHPNVLNYKTHWYKEVEGSKEEGTIVMELCKGGEVFEKFDRDGGSYSEAVAARIILALLKALSHCHSKNVAHRDLKPENLLFRAKDEEEIVLIDFGCANLAQDSQTVTSRCGTLYYLAPEVLDPKSKLTGKTWKASDMWSVGIIAYLLVCGFPPFDHSKEDELKIRIFVGKWHFPSIKKLGYALSPDCKNFIRGLLVLDSSKRMSADDAMNHPWLIQANNEVMPGLAARLSAFHDNCKLKKAVAKVLVDRPMNEAEKARVAVLFKKFDKDGNGRLNGEELCEMYKSMGRSEAEAAAMLSEMDEDGDGNLDIDEMAHARAVEGAATELVDDARANEAFAMFDNDHDGTVSADEIMQLCHLDPTAALEMIKEVDANGDGRIGIEEWAQAMKGFKGK